MTCRRFEGTIQQNTEVWIFLQMKNFFSILEEAPSFTFLYVFATVSPVAFLPLACDVELSYCCSNTFMFLSLAQKLEMSYLMYIELPPNMSVSLQDFCNMSHNMFSLQPSTLRACEIGVSRLVPA